MRLIGEKSISRQLTLLFVIASSSVLLALGIVIASTLEKHFEQEDMNVLTGKMELVRHTLEKLKSLDDLENITPLLTNSLVGHHDLEVLVINMNHEVMFTTPTAGFPIDLVAASATRNLRLPITWTLAGQTYRGIAAELPTSVSERSRAIVAVAINIAHHQAFMRSFLQLLWVFVVGAAALTGILGWGAVRRGLAPLRAMREQAQAVTAQQLNHRLPLKAMPVELVELAQSLNEMLARLEQAFLRLSDFSSDIAHELRTPVSNLMTESQVTLSRPRNADEYRSILESNVEEFERLARMISAMLLLAKAENGLIIPNRETINLAKEVRALFDYYDAIAEEKGLRFVLEGDANVDVDQPMFRRALDNLLSNAVRYSFANTLVRVSIKSSNEIISICIENKGETIPQAYLERIFDRFVRVDQSRQRSAEGAGLGLAITKSIVAAHGGTISVESSDQVTKFTIRLPRNLSTLLHARQKSPTELSAR